jgi:KAP-like P-loop domain-containing protein
VASIREQLELALAQAPLVLAIYDRRVNSDSDVVNAVPAGVTRVVLDPRELLDGEVSSWARDERVVGIIEQGDPDLAQVRDNLSDLSHRVIRIEPSTEASTEPSEEPEAAPLVRERLMAGYSADTDDWDDKLGITPDVEMLADLVASRLIKPPLSIGLFGNWGSGKSFFMRQMRGRIRELADAAAAEEKAKGRHGRSVSSYCSGVRQITFNAWHYAEANLWASLAAHIFDNLASGGSEDDLKRRADQLASLRGKEKSLLTQLSAARLERMMVAAQHEREPFTLDLTHDDFEWVEKALGVPKASLEEVRDFATGKLGIRAKARRVLSLFKHSKLAWILLASGVVLTVGIVFLVTSPLWPAITAAVSTLVAAVTPYVREVQKAATRITDAANTKQAATGKRLADLDAETDRLERAVAELATAHDATAFAQSRQASDDYTQYLGVVSQLRRDLETFAAILEQDQQAGGLERIVLYVDDLDRCAPDVVVKVLEAIHLLVALPVFVVVVAVDARWLRQSIEQHYAEMRLSAADYLEKIFQVPFQLSPMDGDGFRGLVSTLASGSAVVPDDLVAAPPSAASSAPSAVSSAASREDSSLRPRQLEISRGELDFLDRLAPLVPSPRATKRLINLYRLLRSRLSGSALSTFVDGDGAAAALVLLAVHAGEARAADGLFTRLGAAGSGMTSLRALLDRYREDEDVSTLCAQLAAIEDMPDALEVYREWLPLVRRFSFGA